MKIADIELGEKPLLLAPMEDVTDPSFRYMCKRFGADVVYTEFISSDGLIRDAAKSLKKLEIDDAERPVGIQLYGHLVEPMVEAARMAEAAGPDIIDINFGCPVKKIAGRGAGSGMMRDVPLMVEMTRRIVEAVGKPVTVKTRLGWDDESKNIEEIALRLQDVGIALRQGALGDDMHREALVGDHAQCPAGQPQLALDGHVGVVHRPRADRGAFFPPGTQLGGQQFQCVALHGYLGAVPDPIAVAARVAVDAPVLASPVEVHVVGDAEPPIGRPQLREDRFGFDIPHGRVSRAR